MGLFDFLKSAHFETRVKLRTQFYLEPWKNELSIKAADLAEALFQESKAQVLSEEEGWGENPDYDVAATNVIDWGLRKLPTTGGKLSSGEVLSQAPVQVQSFDRVIMICALGRALEMIGNNIDYSKFDKYNRETLMLVSARFYSEASKLPATHRDLKAQLMRLDVPSFTLTE